jgi:phage tail tape-measure protein
MSTTKNPDKITKVKVEPNPASNPDPITGAPQSHPVGTAVGAASGAGAGALGGAAVGGPVGAALGAAVGAVVGAVSGHAAAEALDPTVETNYWRLNYKTRPYYKEGRTFGDYEAAYRYGWENAVTRKGMSFEEAEKAHLARGWAAARGETRHVWEDVRDASRDAWTRVRQSLKP